MTLEAAPDSGDILFVYFGKKLPEYAQSSLELAKRYSGLTPVLISDASPPFALKRKGVPFVPIQEFYDPRGFHDLLGRFSRSTTSRAGLWRYSLERFFVLSQFARAFEKPSFVHAELDQLLFRVDLLRDKVFSTQKKGLFLPFASRDLAVASIVLCNEIETLDHFLNFVKRSKTIDNEMRLLARWAPSSERNLFALATPAHSAGKIALTPDGIEILGAEVIRGAVDAAQIGQWFGGADPRNIPWPEKPRTKFVELWGPNFLNPNDFADFQLKLESGSNLLKFSLGGRPRGNLYNLHLHSKIHSWVRRNPGNLNVLLTSSNQREGTVIPGTRTTQVFHLLRRFAGTMTRRMVRRGKNLLLSGKSSLS